MNHPASLPQDETVLPRRVSAWWPLAIGPAVIIVFYLSRPMGLDHLFSRGVQDDTPLPYALTLAAFAVALWRGVAARNPLMLMLAAMALAIFNREVHWEIVFADGREWSPCSIIAYATLATVCAIGWKRYEVIRPYLTRGRIAQWLIISAATYVLAVAIAKGWIKFLIYDDRVIRDHLEETMENVAHLLLLLTTFTGGKARTSNPSAATTMADHAKPDR